MLTLSRNNEYDLSEEAKNTTQKMVESGISSIEWPPVADVKFHPL